MSSLWLTALIVLWLVVLLLGFLLLGALRSLGLLNWRLEQLEATMPKRLGRDGLKVGAKAPDFTLPCVNPNTLKRFPANCVERSPEPARLGSAEWSDQETAPRGGVSTTTISLHDFIGRKVLLV